MKVLMIFDQIQAGMGGKERADLPLGGKRGPIGAVPMLEPHLKKLDEEVIACLYCGDGYFKEHEEEVVKKMAAMAKKLRPDVVICGPALLVCVHLLHMKSIKKQIFQLLLQCLKKMWILSQNIRTQ